MIKFGVQYNSHYDFFKRIIHSNKKCANHIPYIYSEVYTHEAPGTQKLKILCRGIKKKQFMFTL